jgi:hypothetical protein
MFTVTFDTGESEGKPIRESKIYRFVEIELDGKQRLSEEASYNAKTDNARHG